MGIKGLSAFLKGKAPIAMAGAPVVRLSTPQAVAVDVPIFLHKFFFSVGRSQLDVSFRRLRQSLHDMNMTPIWVFDGKRLDLKDGERQRRAAARVATAQREADRRAEITTMDPFVVVEGTFLCDEVDTPQEHVVVPLPDAPCSADYAQVRLTLANDDVRVAQYEAEALCSFLVSTNQAHAALTNDTDAFAYLCPRVILNASVNLGGARVVETHALVQELGVTPTQFQTMCVHCGNDFVDNVRGVGPVKAWELCKRGEAPNGCDVERCGRVQDVFASFCFEKPLE